MGRPAIGFHPLHFRCAAAFVLLFLNLFSGRAVAAEPQSPSPTAEATTASIQDFLANAPAWGEQKKVRVTGVVTHSTSDKTFFIQEGHSGVYAFHHPEKKLAPGDLVEVTGNPSLGGITPTLQNCTVKSLGIGKIPEPVLLTSSQAAQPTNAMKLARLSGRLQEHRLAGGRTLLLRPENSDPAFEVDAEGLTNLNSLDQFQEGSLIEATGIVVAKSGPDRKTAGIRLLIDSPEDLVVLKGPPFWTTTHLAEAVTFAGGALVLAFAWIAMLRREVKRQTAVIAQRLEKEAALRASEDRFLKVFRTTPELLLIVRNADEKIVDVNPAFEKLSGYDRSEAIGKTTVDLGVYVNPQSRREIISQFREGKPVANVSVNTRRKTGEPLWLLASMEWIEWNGEKCWLCVARNVTEQKRAEEQQHQLELARLQSQKMEALGTMAGGIAHDFNNILAAILGNAELAKLEVQAASSGISEMLTGIESAAIRGRNLVSQIQAFTRKQRQNRQSMTLDETVEESARLLRAIAPASITIETKIHPGCPPAFVDADSILQSLINLGTNGCHAMENRPGKLTIALEPITVNGTTPNPELLPGDYLRLTVSDQGDGMEEQTVRRIFDPFFTTKAPGKGTGLGLAITHNIVTSHGGVILVDSAPGAGSKFSIYLPASTPSAATQTARSTNPPLPERGSGESILMVDDEPEVMTPSKRILEKLGYKVTALTNPHDALELVEAKPHEFRLLLSDLNMPAMSGLQLIATVRRMRSDLPIILISGFITDELRAQSSHDTALHLLDKPVKAAELTTAIRTALQKSQPVR
jgi:PAS domain S-box-containing protein